MNIERLVQDFLCVTVASHKRRVAIRQGLREPSTENCDHANWDYSRQWCKDCAVTLRELVQSNDQEESSQST